MNLSKLIEILVAATMGLIMAAVYLNFLVVGPVSIALFSWFVLWISGQTH